MNFIQFDCDQDHPLLFEDLFQSLLVFHIVDFVYFFSSVAKV